MAMSDTIDISSSDSDLEIEDMRATTHSSNLRKLPNSFSGSGPNSNAIGYRGTLVSNGGGVNLNGHTRGKVPNHVHYIEDAGPSNRSLARAQIANNGADGDVYRHQSVNSRISNFGNDFEKISSQQAINRTLPSSNNESHRKIPNWDTYGVPHHSPGPSSTQNKSYSRESSYMGSDSNFYMHGNSGSRILPPSMMQPRSSATASGSGSASAHFASPSDSTYRPGTGEERVAESDERLIYQAALEDLNQPKNEANLPEGLLSVPLLRHQKIALAWMLQKETRSLHCLGGILADDQGLGKTISMISLIQMQRFLQSRSKSEELGSNKTVALDIDDDDEGDNGNVGSTNKKKTEESSDVKPSITVALDLDDNDEGSTAKTEESHDIKPIPVISTSARVFNKRRPDAGTLVVCPASVLRQWARELEDKVSEESKLSVLIYHGGSRTKDPVELAKFDVVLTTYAIVTNEVPKQPLVDEEEDEKNGERYGLSSEFSSKRKKKVPSVVKKRKKGGKGFDADYDCGALARVGWSRVILDEAQTIKNHRTQVARACCSLRAKRRWCLSGTPIQNSIDDLYSYFRFLRYDPYAVYRSFCSTIKLPISRNAVQGYKKLQAVLRAIMLRRTKGTLIDGEPIIKLPPKDIKMCKVNFSSEERAFYSQLEADSRTQFKAYAAAGTVNQNYANILLMLLRLRQACDHPSLVKEYKSDFVGKDSAEMARRLPQDLLINLLKRLEASLAICDKCDDPPEDPVVTMCEHVFCYECVAEHLNGDDNICPATMCKEQIGSDLVFSKLTLRRSISDDLDGSSSDSQLVDKTVLQTDYSSSKIKSLMEILQSDCELDGPDSESCSYGGSTENSFPGKEIADGSCSSVGVVRKHTNKFSILPNAGPVKTIVFSQWTSMLDLVEAALNQTCINYRRLDGQMSLVARDRGVKDFNTNPEVTVMIMSLKAGNLGLNMVAASRVVLLDLWWNPTTEDQAVDRAHRIGQTRPVTVTRLTIQNTVEDRILALQEEKRKMVASAFGEDQTGGSATRLTVDDLKYLFMV